MPRQRPIANCGAAGGRRRSPRPLWFSARICRKQSPAMAGLVSIPSVDVREGGPVRHAVDARARARSLRDDCVTWLPRAARMLLPAMDALTRRWLKRSYSPYIAELEAITAALGFPGSWFLNGTYQSGCSALALEGGGVAWAGRPLRSA